MKYFKRKAAKNDFTENDLPKTRREQFFTIIKNDFMILLFIGLILLLFYIPMLVVDIFKVNILSGILQTYTGDEQLMMVQMTRLIYGGIAFICGIIFSLGMAGVTGIYKRLVWGKPIFFKEDYKDSFKSNYKQYLLLSIIGGLIGYVCILVEIFNPNNVIVQSIAYGINVVVFIPLALEFMICSSFYSNKFFKTLSNSVILYLKTFLFLIAACALIYIIYFINFIPYLIIAGITKAVFIIVLLPLILLFAYSAHIYKYDDLINEKTYPNIYKRGINNN